MSWHSLVLMLDHRYIFCFFSAQLTKVYQTASVLFEVLKAVNMTQSLEVDHEVKFSFSIFSNVA